MNNWMKYAFLTIAALGVSGCSTTMNLSSSSTGVTSSLNLGDQESEARHNVKTEDAEVVRETYPDHWINAARASAYTEGHEPYRVIDGDSDTSWKVAGTNPYPGNEQWIELEMNHVKPVDEISIKWVGDTPYKFTIYSIRRSDFRRKYLQGERKGNPEKFETYTLPETMERRGLRIAFEAKEKDTPAGIKEVRIGGLSWPSAYPPAAHPDAGIKSVQRPLYHELNTMLTLENFNLGRLLADGGSARRILSTKEFEGGHVDFNIAVAPEKQNWITLKLWASKPELMTKRGNAIALEVFATDPDKKRHWYLPKYMNEEQNWDHEWYGLKPEPGRWVYATYKLPRHVTKGQKQMRLRLQGIGNERRDHPMRAPAPPVYRVISHTNPFFN